MEQVASAVFRAATGSTRAIVLTPDFLLTTYCSGSEVTDSEDIGGIYSAEKEKGMNTELLSSEGAGTKLRYRIYICLTDLKGCSAVLLYLFQVTHTYYSSCNNPTKKGNTTAYITSTLTNSVRPDIYGILLQGDNPTEPLRFKY